MLTRVRHQVVRQGINRPKRAALVVALFAALSTSSAFAQCRGGSGGMGGSGGSSGTAGTAGTGLAGMGMGGIGMAGMGMANSPFAAMGQGQGGQSQSSQGFFAVPSEQMFQPAFQPIVDDNRQYLAARRALRAAKAEQARQRLASRKERPSKPRVVAANLSRE